MDKQYDKRIRRARRRTESKNTNRFTKNNTKKISNWKTPGHDGTHCFWFKKFTSISRQTRSRNKQMPTKSTRTRMDDQRKDYISRRTPFKRTAPNNYWPITCLPMMWKILTAQIRKGIYNSLTRRRLFPKEQKGRRKGSRGTGELLHIDQHILNESKTRRKRVRPDKKAYDIVLQCWIINCLTMYKISDEVIDLIKKTIKTWWGDIFLLFFVHSRLVGFDTF